MRKDVLSCIPSALLYSFIEFNCVANFFPSFIGPPLNEKSSTPTAANIDSIPLRLSAALTTNGYYHNPVASAFTRLQWFADDKPVAKARITLLWRCANTSMGWAFRKTM